jgi:hypothetical protein
MYRVNNEKFTSFTKAVAEASSKNEEVFQVNADGSESRRWTPAPAPSSKKVRQYREKLAAYKAQQGS